MITHWISYSLSSYDFSQFNTKIKSNPKYLLVKLDMYAFYYPIIFFEKFDYIKCLLHTNVKLETMPIKDEIVNVLDLSKNFLETVNFNQLNFSEFIFIFHSLLTGDTKTIKIFKEYYKPLLPFFEFLCLDDLYLKIVSN